MLIWKSINVQKIYNRLRADEAYKDIEDKTLKELVFSTYNDLARELGLEEIHPEILVNKINDIIEKYHLSKVYHVTEAEEIVYNPKAFSEDRSAYLEYTTHACIHGGWDISIKEMVCRTMRFSDNELTEDEYNSIKDTNYSNKVYLEIYKKRMLNTMGIKDANTIDSTKLMDIMPLDALVNAVWKVYNNVTYGMDYIYSQSIVESIKFDIKKDLSDGYLSLDVYSQMENFLKSTTYHIEFPKLTKEEITRILRDIRENSNDYKDDNYITCWDFIEKIYHPFNLNNDEERQKFIKHYENKFTNSGSRFK